MVEVKKGQLSSATPAYNQVCQELSAKYEIQPAACFCNDPWAKYCVYIFRWLRKKNLKRILFSWHENDTKFRFQHLWIKLYWNTTTLFMYCVWLTSCSSSTVRYSSCIRDLRPRKLKIFTLWPFIGKVADLCFS